jgi:hypothetical protein
MSHYPEQGVYSVLERKEGEWSPSFSLSCLLASGEVGPKQKEEENWKPER